MLASGTIGLSCASQPPEKTRRGARTHSTNRQLMTVTQVALRPTEASNAANRPALTPELLAASGARYSRSNDGLQAILSKIDPNNLDKSVDGIFKMIDYGHQSIADMAPVAMFIDEISIHLAYYVWTLVPTAGGQESSTRYIRLSADSLPSAATFGIPNSDADEWRGLMADSFQAYLDAVALWESVAAAIPDVTRIPRSLLEDSSTKAQKTVARMQRNYAFDRARYFLPVAAATNMMLIMSARGWVTLCQSLLSHPLPEAVRLGELIRQELAIAAPRMLRHATEKPSFVQGLRREFARLQQDAIAAESPYLLADSPLAEHPSTPHLAVMPPPDVDEAMLMEDLADHDNRYSFVGERLKRVAVRFWWDAMAMGEIRDLNRHRTGTKSVPLRPVGFYAALDQWPQQLRDSEQYKQLCQLEQIGKNGTRRAYQLLRNGDHSHPYWTLLGTQYPFEHTTTADKFLYEAELRTGTGAHYRYARHLHEALQLWYQHYPATCGVILEGSAEPE